MDISSKTPSAISFADLPATEDRGALIIEYRWLNASLAHEPVVVFLHEGLGSIAMWKDWPQSLCDALGYRGLVYSRPGYGASTPRDLRAKLAPDFMHKQALDVLPALLDALHLDAAQKKRMWLLGHSDGGSIALLYAATFPQGVGQLVVIAPHVIVEQKSIDAIGQTKLAYEQATLRAKLSRYHRDVDSAFYGWNDIWLDPAFRAWDITDELASIRCPVLAIQGHDDEYGTMRQIDLVKEHVPQSQLLKLRECGHSPHRQLESELNQSIVIFRSSLTDSNQT